MGGGAVHINVSPCMDLVMITLESRPFTIPDTAQESYIRHCWSITLDLAMLRSRWFRRPFVKFLVGPLADSLTKDMISFGIS